MVVVVVPIVGDRQTMEMMWHYVLKFEKKNYRNDQMDDCVQLRKIIRENNAKLEAFLYARGQ